MKRIALIFTVAALLCGCTKSPAPVPRPDGFPRVEAYPADYRAVGVDGAILEVNALAEVAETGPGWLTVTYPCYGASVYFTISDFADDPVRLREAIANRRQRIYLNVGDNPTEVETIEAEPYHTYIICAPEARQMPLQILATDGKRTLVSAAVYFPGAQPSSSLDSLRPMVDVLHRDLRHMAQTLRMHE